MPELISECIVARAGTADAGRMALGEPGLPAGFAWRGEDYNIVDVLSTWKHSSREGSSAQGQLYLRRHYYELRMSDGSLWTVYFSRQNPRSGNPKARWFLYLREGLQ